MRRLIRQEETDLIQYLISRLPEGSSQYSIPSEVLELEDGRMGSLQLNNNGTRHKDLIQMKYHDSDGQTVLITLTENQSGELFDFDIWKVDFRGLIIYPKPEDLKSLS